MRVLVACEFSGVVRDAFARRGHDAWSCDLSETERPGQHIKGEVELYLEDGWDLMVAHPPCTYLCRSGLHWNKRRPGRDVLTHEAMLFVFALMDAPIPRIALENPIGCISTLWRKPDQVVQPWMFGVPESKATCWWLKNLPLLRPTNCLALPEGGLWKNQTRGGQNKEGESKSRWKNRSRMCEGMADAIAEQWGSLPVIGEE